MPESLNVRMCPNCGALLQGEYCHDCGQQDLDLDRPFVSLMGEWLGNLFAFDARLWRTLGPLMARPGVLTSEYLAGRRARYVPPLRLYFFASIAMFLALAWSGYSIVHHQDDAQSGPITVFSSETGTPTPEEAGPEKSAPSWWAQKLEALTDQPDEVVNTLYRQRLAQTLILLACAFAVFSRVLFPRPHRRLFHHLVLSIHIHAAAFTGIVATQLLSAVLDRIRDGIGGFLSVVFLVYVLTYVFMALRRVHGYSRPSTLWRYLILGLLYLVTLILTLASTLLLTAIFL